MGWACGIFLALLGLFVLVCIPHNLRIWRVRRQYRGLPEDVRNEVFQLIRAAAAKGPCVRFLFLDGELPCTEPEILLHSHVGGIPYAEAGDIWPSSPDKAKPNGSGARFLLQVRIDEPSLGEQWQGRLLAVFWGGWEAIVRSYAYPSLQKYVAISSPAAPFDCIRFLSLPFPTEIREEEGEDPLPMSPKGMCEKIPELCPLLGQYTKDCPGLLAQILRPQIYNYDLEEADLAYQGGHPTLIQCPHQGICNDCNRPMRFLFQFGEIIPRFQLADGGVIYIYGCDFHPDHCKAFLDSQ